MKAILRSILIVAAGFVAGGLVIGAVEWIGHYIWPPPPGIEDMDAQALREAMAKVPAAALRWVLAAWVLGSLAGGAVAAALPRRGALLHALGSGILLLAAGIAAMLAIPHPAWFRVAGLAVFVPCAAVGGFFGWKHGGPWVDRLRARVNARGPSAGR